MPSPEEGYTILDGVNKIIDILENGGSGGGLPEVTSDDEGKVLTVVDNDGTYEWEAAIPSGSGGALILHTVEDDEYVYLDKTAAEIIAAMPLVYVEMVAPLEDTSTGHAFLGMYVLEDIMGYKEIDGTYVFSVELDSEYSADSLNERPKYLKEG